MTVISPFTPLRFDDGTKSDGLPSRYVQVFAPTDRIMLQVFTDVGAGDAVPVGKIYDAHTDNVIASIDWSFWLVDNNTKMLYFNIVSGLSIGHYYITINGIACDEFRVTDDEAVLARSTLIQYSFKDNRQREDVIAILSNVHYFFDWRVPGGFKDSGWQFGVDNEQFATQHQDLVELYAREYLTKTFTMGGPVGVPVWYGELLNRVLTCPYVYFDAVRYMRNESEVPSMNTIVEGLDSFVFTQSLRKSSLAEKTIEEANQVAIRRVDATYNRIDTEETENPLIIET